MVFTALLRIFCVAFGYVFLPSSRSEFDCLFAERSAPSQRILKLLDKHKRVHGAHTVDIRRAQARDGVLLVYGCKAELLVGAALYRLGEFYLAADLQFLSSSFARDITFGGSPASFATSIP